MNKNFKNFKEFNQINPLSYLKILNTFLVGIYNFSNSILSTTTFYLVLLPEGVLWALEFL